MKVIEPGTILSLDGGIMLIDRSVHAVTTDNVLIPIGVIPWENVSWFNYDNKYTILKNATKIVFMEDGIFSLKHLTQPLDEFIQMLDTAAQEDVINKYVELLEKERKDES